MALAALTACLAGGTVSAADLPSTKAPPVPPAPVFTWTGPYAGLNIGWGGANTGWVDGIAFASPTLAPTGVAWSRSSPDASGVIGGAQVGYNYQFPGTGFVVGLETDFNGADVNATSMAIGSPVTGTNVFPVVRSYEGLSWFGTVRGRLGYAVLPNLLIFGTGGFAYGHVTNSFQIGFTNGFFDGAAHSGVNTGWAAGGGVEWAFWPNLSLRAEYLYVDLGDSHTLWDGACGCNPPKPPTPPVPPTPLAPAAFIAAQSGAPYGFHTARLGLNYHFNLFPTF